MLVDADRFAERHHAFARVGADADADGLVQGQRAVRAAGLQRLEDVFLVGMKIMRRTKGTRRYVYTFVGDEAFASIKRKVKALTGRSTTNLSLSELLRRLNPILRGRAGPPNAS